MTRRSRDQRGQASVIIIGFAIVVLFLVAVVVDSSAAYLKRQSLDTLADGAALRAADLAAEGNEVYGKGLDAGDLRLSTPAAKAAVRDYLRQVRAHHSHPGLSYGVRVRGTRVVVTVSATVDLPLTIPGAIENPRVSATASAVVRPD